MSNKPEVIVCVCAIATVHRVHIGSVGSAHVLAYAILVRPISIQLLYAKLYSCDWLVRGSLQTLHELLHPLPYTRGTLHELLQRLPHARGSLHELLHRLPHARGSLPRARCTNCCTLNRLPQPLSTYRVRWQRSCSGICYGYTCATY